MNCVHCGTALSDTADFCSQCGNSITPDAAAEDPQMQPPVQDDDIADLELAELSHMIQHFSQKQASYDLYHNICERINYFARSTPTVLTIWGSIILSFALLLAVAILFLLRGGILNTDKLYVLLAAYGCLIPVPGILMITAGVWIRVSSRRKLTLSQQQFDMLSQELYLHFQSYPSCPVSPEYTNPRLLRQLQNLIYYGGTNTIKESLNQLLASSNRKAIARYLKLLCRNTAGHGSDAIFLPPNFFMNSLEL